MTPMCDSSGVMVGWAIGTADCADTVELEYFDVDGASEGGSLPSGWKPCVQGVPGPGWAPTIETLTYSSTQVIDFLGADFQIVTLAGDIEFSGANYNSPDEVSVIVKNGATPRTVDFPVGWVFVTSKPTTIDSDKTALLHLISTTTAATGVIAEWEVEP